MNRFRLVPALKPGGPRAVAAEVTRRPRLRLPKAWPPLLLAPAAILLLAAAQPAGPEPPTPASPREFFNAGTRTLATGKLKEAEALLETALSSQVEPIQPAALYNLGHVRFNQGLEELKKGPSAKPALAKGKDAAQHADEAIQSADGALAGNRLDQMVAAYRRGRGTRKELKEAVAAVRRALQTCGAALNRWDRASGDFHGALELQPADADARQNAEIVDRCIAKLVDTLRDMQELANALGDKKQELGQKLKDLKGRLPAEDAPPGGAGEDDEDDDQPKGPQPGQEEGPGKEGEETSMSPEQAGWLLDGFKLDGERRLPMGQGEEAEPKNRNRPTW
jgi:tetratricopeptide (TPR) repeat protein